MKSCSKCGNLLPLSEFFKYKSAAGKYCRRAECRSCRAAYLARWYDANRDKCRLKAIDYRVRNKEKIRAKKQAFFVANADRIKYQRAMSYVRNREKIRARQKTYYKANKQAIYARTYAWVAANRERRREYLAKYAKEHLQESRAWRHRNLSRVMANDKLWKKNNPDKVRASKKRRDAKWRENLHTIYVKQKIMRDLRTLIRPSDIPKELVELKRAQLMLARKLKEIRK